ncbi:MAG: sulfatase-like hydrolase/transferase [Chitinophagaceae bacterium]|nr:sulfatase-like hydrolase/transferase [Chitinophagaceae bacterium]
MKANSVYKFIFAAFSIAAYSSLNAQYSPLKPFDGVIGKTLEETKQSWPERVKAPAGAPNVIWILLDDVGFGASSAFGGLIETPEFEKLANNGIRYTNFHTTGICSPTRAALLTGRNSHSVAMGHHAELGIGTPGYNGDIPLEAGTIAETLKENGYNTFALGKWHGNNPDDYTAAGPFNRYPTGRGFEHFYGFLGGATDQFHPQLVEENNPVNIEPNTKHLNELLADKAISYIANQKSANPEKPFFLYLAPGATHAPHHVPQNWINKYKGKFDGGWDKYREDVFKRQQSLGLLQKGTKLPQRQTGIKAWNTLSADEKKVYARFFEVYAAFLSYTDYEIGRVVNYLKEIDQLDNTAIFLIIGDNGGSKEGTYTGSVGIGNAERSSGNDIKFLLSQYDKIGTEFSNPNYPLGWSQAANTPFRYWKSDANSEGATHNPLIVHYPNGIKDKGTIRTQYLHVTDIYPTTIELTGTQLKDNINGYAQLPFHGVSFVYTVTQPAAPTKHTQQYYELHGGRSIYKDGWKASVYHPRNIYRDSSNTDVNFTADFKRDKWELYNLNEDWNETNDLAAKNPQKLEELKALFDTEATKYNVYPLKNYGDGLRVPVIKPKTVIYEHTSNKTRVNIGKGQVIITANIELKDSKDEGVIFANGGLFGGSSLFIQNGKLNYFLNDGVEHIVLSSSQSLAVGKNAISIEYTESNSVILSVNGKKVAEEKISTRNKYLNSFAGEGVSVGRDLNSPVSKSYPAVFPFTGAVKTLIIEQSNTTSLNASR